MKVINLIIGTLLFIIFASYSATSQNKETVAFNKVKEIYFKKVLGQNSGETSIFFNRSEKAIDIIGFQIPLLSVKIKYTESDFIKNAKHFVQFICETKGCILKSEDDDNEQTNSFGVPFGSKQDCYEFINALAELRIALEKM